MHYLDEYRYWSEQLPEKKDILSSMSDSEIEDAFYKSLKFGTGGLRGILGLGTNRMNEYTVNKASQGIADYLNSSSNSSKVVICYDSRIMSEEFAKCTAGVFAGNGINVLLFPRLMPTPCLSFAIRYYHCDVGIMITASHNPAEYNGYKVYGPDGCQITDSLASTLYSHIEKVDYFKDIHSLDYEEASNKGLIDYVTEECMDSYIDCVKTQQCIFYSNADKNLSIVYSPLNGTGLEPVTRVLSECGFSNVFVVPEQKQPDGSFPTCPKPNPEEDETLRIAISYAEERNADAVIATDPDCDRVGLVVKDTEKGFIRLSGNEVGILLFDYIIDQKRSNECLPADPLLIKTIVTTEMADVIAASNNISTINVLTGFKYIGEQIGLLEKERNEGRFLFGFEESCGYLSGTDVRDKDAVVASLLICEMLSVYKAAGIPIMQKLKMLRKEYGFFKEKLLSYTFKSVNGDKIIAMIMDDFRENRIDLNFDSEVLSIDDYLLGLNGLPKSNVLKYSFSSGDSMVIRPSGTEPKLKIYLSIKGVSENDATSKEHILSDAVESAINSYRV